MCVIENKTDSFRSHLHFFVRQLSQAIAFRLSYSSSRQIVNPVIWFSSYHFTFVCAEERVSWIGCGNGKQGIGLCGELP